MNSKFKIDDYVKYTSNRYCDSVYNPLWGGVNMEKQLEEYMKWVEYGAEKMQLGIMIQKIVMKIVIQNFIVRKRVKIIALSVKEGQSV